MKVEYVIRFVFICLAVWALFEGITTYRQDPRGMIVSGILAAIFATIACAGICKPSEENENG